MITSAQIRAARAALGWTALQLAEEAGLSHRTVQNLEAQGSQSIRKSSLLALKAALEAAGIEFIGTTDSAPGIRIHSHPDK